MEFDERIDKHIVTEDMTALAMKSGDLEVLATPALVAAIEYSCKQSITKLLTEKQTTVGTKIAIDHVSATPLGLSFETHCTLVGQVDRKLFFEVEAFDDFSLIASGKHERFIVDSEKFLNRLNSKKR